MIPITKMNQQTPGSFFIVLYSLYLISSVLKSIFLSNRSTSFISYLIYNDKYAALEALFIALSNMAHYQRNCYKCKVKAKMQ